MRTRSTLLVPGALAVALLGALGAPASPAVATDRPTVGGALLAGDGLVVDAPGAAALPTVKASSWVLADLGTGEVLAALSPHSRQRPASTLKILTALTVLPLLDPDASYTARSEDANAEGSRAGLVPDASYTVHNLLEALFLVSGNDAASALANAAGGLGPTIGLMNQTARDLGALDTTAVNPSGLDAPGQLTSAYDLAVLTRAGMAREDFRAYAGTVKSQLPGKMPRAGKVRKTFEIYTTDRLLLNYRGAIGVKNGWTTKARSTFVGAATRGDRTLVATVMHTDFDAWREAAALLTWGFQNAALAEPVGTLDAVPVPVADAAGQGTGADVRSVAAAGTPAADEGGLPWLVRVPIVLLAVVVLLRARVLVRRRVRRVRLVAGQPRALRRDTAAASAAPRPAPSRTPRSRPRDPDEPVGPSASSATAS